MSARQEIRWLLGCAFWGAVAWSIATCIQTALAYAFPPVPVAVASDFPSLAFLDGPPRLRGEK